MARTGKITLFEGTGKASQKPFTAIKLEVGTWNVLYFPKSNFEMEYIKSQLTQPETAEEVVSHAEESKKNTKGLFS